LRIKKTFATWLKYNLKKINLKKGRDYSKVIVFALKGKNSGGRSRIDDLLSLAAAKYVTIITKSQIITISLHAVRR